MSIQRFIYFRYGMVREDENSKDFWLFNTCSIYKENLEVYSFYLRHRVVGNKVCKNLWTKCCLVPILTGISQVIFMVLRAPGLHSKMQRPHLYFTSSPTFSTPQFKKIDTMLLDDFEMVILQFLWSINFSSFFDL